MNAITTPKWFVPVVVIALIWNLIGVFAFFSEMSKTPEALMALSEAEQALYANQPIWSKIAFALAVFGGTVGSLGLLLKKKWASPVLTLSLLGIVVQMFHSLVIAKSTEVYGPGAVVMPILVMVVGIVLVWLARRANSQGWLV